jgi:hypothetical protein
MGLFTSEKRVIKYTKKRDLLLYHLECLLVEEHTINHPNCIFFKINKLSLHKKIKRGGGYEI